MPSSADRATAPIAVTGSTGRLGGRVANRLAAVGAKLRLLGRDASRIPRLPGAAAAVADYADRDAVRRALTGVETVFMVSAAESEQRVAEHRAFVDGAVDAGVQHVVYTSVYGASATATFTLARDHWHTEQYLRASGLSVTFLRDNLYLDFLPSMVGADGIIRGPADGGHVAAVATDDVADVAAVVLRAPDAHRGATYDLNGPQSLTLEEVAEVISAVTGRRVRFHDESLAEAYASRASYGAPDWQVEAWVTTYTAIAAGEFDAVSTAIRDLTGHPATSLTQLLRRGWPTSAEA